MEGIDELKTRYPWPDERPAVREDWTGWFAGQNRTALAAAINGKTQVIVELGSFCGLSAKFLADLAPNATLVCIDHWKGSTEHHRREDWEKRLATLFETFQRNLWDHRHHVVPMRTTTLAGLRELHALGIVPDLIYVDAAHEEDHVYADTDLSLRLFPKADIIGDDWPHDSVRAGVVRAARRCGELLIHGGCCWQIGQNNRLHDRRPPPDPYPEPNDTP